MSALQKKALSAIARELRSILGRRDSLAERLESAGRLLLAAVKEGAFGAPEFTGFGTMIEQRAEQENVNGFISAWIEAVWMLRGRPKAPPAPELTFADDIEHVIAIMPGTFPTEPAPANESTTQHDIVDRLRQMKGAAFLAYQQRAYAQERAFENPAGQQGDKAAHDWLSENGDEDGNRPKAFQTWSRYLRSARRQLGENDNRLTRPRSSSVVSSDQI